MHLFKFLKEHCKLGHFDAEASVFNFQRLKTDLNFILHVLLKVNLIWSREDNRSKEYAQIMDHSNQSQKLT